MVQVRVDKPLTSSGELDVDAWIERLRDLSEIDDDGKKALALACEKVIEVEGLP